MMTLDAVSYTHLDVYKRQILHCLRHRSQTLFRSADTLKKIAQNLFGQAWPLDVIRLGAGTLH